MAKRFFDTRLPKKKWFRDAPLHIQLAYLFLLSECDVAGIWDIDLAVMSLYAKVTVTLSDLQKFLNDGKERIRVIDSETKIWIVDFVAFQYGLLSKSSPPHRPVIKRLTELGLPLPLRVVLSVTPQEKEEEKDKYKDKEKEKEEEKARIQKLIDDFKSKFPDKETTA